MHIEGRDEIEASQHDGLVLYQFPRTMKLTICPFQVRVYKELDPEIN
jgi:hypothetical protein